MNKAFNKVNYSALICSFLTLFLFFSFSSSLEVSQWDKGNPSGNITNEYINNTYINQTLELNTTQFETGEPATIKTSWLTSFIESISKWANYYTKTEIDNRYSNNTGDQDLSTYVEGNMSAETYNETTIIPTTNYSLSFDGVNDYVGMESSIDIGTNNFTISSWFKATPTSLNKFFIDNGDSSLYTSRVLIGIAPNGKVRFFTNNENNVASEFYTINTYNDNNWHFAVFTRDNNNLSMYINGVLQKSQPVYGNLGNRSFAIGRSKISSDSTRYFNGSIDEVLIFNRSLSSDEISQLYNSGRGLYANTSIAPFNDGLVAGYHFDEGTGTTAYDITGRNNGTLVNGPTWVDGKISHNLTSTTETLGAIGLMPWVSSTNFISTDFSLQWLNNILLNPWNTISQLGNSTNRFNVFAWNLTADKYFSSDGTEGWTGNCVNASYKDGLVVGCND